MLYQLIIRQPPKSAPKSRAPTKFAPTFHDYQHHNFVDPTTTKHQNGGDDSIYYPPTTIKQTGQTRQSIGYRYHDQGGVQYDVQRSPVFARCHFVRRGPACWTAGVRSNGSPKTARIKVFIQTKEEERCSLFHGPEPRYISHCAVFHLMAGSSSSLRS